MAEDLPVLSLSPPSPFLPHPGEPTIPWEQWKTSFETYLLATGLDAVPTKRKMAILLHCLGVEGQRVFRTLGDADDYAAAITLLDRQFEKKQSLLLKRLQFRQRRQRAGESISQYVADLRGLAKPCCFGTLSDEMIRDQLIEKTNNTLVRERLLLEDDDLTLEKAVILASQIESAAQCAAKLNTTHEPCGDMIQECTQVHGAEADVDHCSSADIQYAQPRAQRRCGNCGSVRHSSRAFDCPARGQTCRRCQKLNHFAKWCRSAPVQVPIQRNSRANATSPAIIHSINSNSAGFSTCAINIADSCIPLLLDTGAKVSLLNMATYERFLSHLHLQPPSLNLFGYGSSTIEVIGLIHAPVQYGNKALVNFPFHITRHGSNILGLDLFMSLDFSLLDNEGTQILTVSCPWQQEWPTLFEGLGCLTAFTHQPLLDPIVKPVIQPLRRIPLALREDVTAELLKLQAEGIIEPVDASPWVSNLTVAKKKSGGLRVCVDLRAVNKAIIPDRYPLPSIEELTTHFHGSTIFSKLDLRQGYLQVPLHPDSRNLTAFVTHTGVFRYTRMPFGLSSAPSCFQKIMSTILAGVPGIAIYLDDIIVHAPNAVIHEQRLRDTFAALSQHNLTLNVEKCLFAVQEVDFVGFHVSAEGLSPLHSNVEAIHQVPEPSSAAQVASFLGMTTYYMRFLPQYSTITYPLRQLLKKDACWTWSTACSDAVRTLKELLTSPPVLAHFSLDCPTLVTCDASATAAGAVLSQLQNGIERPVAFASRAFNLTEQKYSVGEREALACVWACERWHVYLYGRKFTLRTDHQALSALMSPSGSGHKPLRMYRWTDRLQQYDFTIQYTSGRDNVVADLLSRSLSSPTTSCNATEDMDLIQLVHAPLTAFVSLEELTAESAADPTLSVVREYALNGWPAQVTPDVQPYARVKHELSCWNDTCLARGHCAVIPAKLRGRVLAMAHEGHLGIVKLKQRCRDLVWWPGLDKDIEQLVRDCTPCLISGKTGSPPPPPLGSLPWPTKPWDHIQLDICGELHDVPHHLRFLVVCYDLHSKWPEVAPVGTVTSGSIIDFLELLFARWGLPRTLTTDNGPQLVSAEFTSYIQSKGIKHIRTSYYHPQSNGGVERFNQSLKNGLRAHLAQGCSFNEALSQTLLHYRAAQHATTGISPAKLMLGRELDLPLHRLRPPTSQDGYSMVEARVCGQQRKAQDRYNVKKKARIPTISPLDWVRVQRPYRKSKLHTFWSQPQQVQKQLGPGTFQLVDGSRWHAGRLRKVLCPSVVDHTQDAVLPCSLLSSSCPLPPALNPVTQQATVQPPPAVSQAKPTRSHTRPVRFQDYLTSFHT